jgi:hypothetical protein
MVSYARPGKLFTANRSLIVRQVGLLKKEVLEEIVNAITEMLREGLK